MEKFKYNAIIKSSNKEEIIKRLEKLGFTKAGYKNRGEVIVTFLRGYYDFFDTIPNLDGAKTKVETNNEEAFLAIAAIREDNGFYVGELLWRAKEGEIMRIDKIEDDKFYYTNLIGDVSPYHSFTPTSYTYKNAKKLTPEEIIAHYTKQTKTNSVGNFKVDDRKIIGYEAPMDLFAGEVKKGYVLIPVTGVGGIKEGQWYAYGDAAKTTAYSRHLPKEIVETWKPVYAAEEETLTLGSSKIKITIGKNKIEADAKNWSVGFISECIANLNPGRKEWGNYKISIPNITIGCATFSREELELIKSTYEKLNK